MRIATSTEHVGIECGDILTILDTIAAAGYDSVDFNANNYCYPGLKYGDTPFFSDEWEAWILKMRAHAESLGLRFVQSHNLIFNYFQPGEATALLNRMVRRAVDACQLLGVQNTVVHPVTVPGATPREAALCLERNAEYYRSLLAYAAERGVNILTENMMTHPNADGSADWHYCDQTGDLLALLDALDAPNWGLCFDTGHAHYMGEDIYQTMLLLGKYIKALHIHDNNRSDDQHVAMYSGTLDWEGFMRGVADCGYAGCFTLESFRSTIRMPLQIKTGMLRELLDISRYMVSRIEEMRQNRQ